MLKKHYIFVLVLFGLSPFAWVETVTNVKQERSHANVRFFNEGSVLPKEKGLPFSESVQVGNILYLSGQLGIKPGSLSLVRGGMKEQALQTMENIRRLLNARGLNMSDVIKCTVMLSDMSLWGEFNSVYKQFFVEPYPARSAFGVNGLALGALVEVECMAVMQ